MSIKKTFFHNIIQLAKKASGEEDSALEQEMKNITLEFERMNQLMMGRELKMIEFKKELRELRSKLGITQEATPAQESLIKGINQQMSFEETKKAMLNLLEDERALEEKLKIEKASVEQKVIERTKELTDERSKLSASINSLSVAYIMVDRNYTILTINQIARQMFFQAKSSPLATTDYTFAKLEEQFQKKVNLKAFLNNCFSEKKPLLLREVPFENKFLKIFITPIVTIGVIGGVILIDDITEAKIIERSKDEFFSIASHELRTPLTAIRGNTSMIKQFYAEKITDADLKDMIEDIHESSVRLISIVNDFLDMSRLEQKKMVFKQIPFDISSLIQSVLGEFKVTSSQQKLSLTYQPQKLPAVYADSNKTRQVLINLLSNAFKFTTQGGISITTQTFPGFIKILVSDTGRGISPLNQTLLFRKFQQANTSLLTRDTTKGTGLGLYISKLIIEGMGGSIKIESSIEGKGSTFSFTLPMATNEQLRQIQPPPDTHTIDSATGLTKPITQS